MKLTKHIIEQGKQYKTPFLLFDLSKIKKKYHEIKNNIKGVEIFYAMKANDHPEIVKILAKEASSFEISSLNELQKLIDLGIPAERVMCLNPIKSPEFLQEMETKGVKLMAFDSYSEIDKIAKYAPDSQVILRMNVSNEGSDWPLTKKFGVDAADAILLFKYAKKKGIQAVGLTFHVGSQCLNKNNWVNALYMCNDMWNQAQREGIALSLLSLGGGIPIQHTKTIPSVSEIGEAVKQVLKRNFKPAGSKLRITIEPGRGLVGDAAIMVTTVVGIAKRGYEDWVYFDVGVFNGLMETVENFMYELRTERNRKKRTVTIGGPSCDSVDIPFKDVLLSHVGIGERVYILNAGAYTTVYAASFNGFEVPKTYFLDK